MFFIIDILAILTGKLTVGVTYVDPDQSPVDGESFEGLVLNRVWELGMDYQPQDPNCRHLSAWLKDIFAGNYERFLKHIDGYSRGHVSLFICLLLIEK